MSTDTDNYILFGKEFAFEICKYVTPNFIKYLELIKSDSNFSQFKDIIYKFEQYSTINSRHNHIPFALMSIYRAWDSPIYKEAFGRTFDTLIGNFLSSFFSSDLSFKNFEQLNVKIAELLFDKKSSKFCDNYEEIKCYFLLKDAVASIDYITDDNQPDFKCCLSGEEIKVEVTRSNFLHFYDDIEYATISHAILNGYQIGGYIHCYPFLHCFYQKDTIGNKDLNSIASILCEGILKRQSNIQIFLSKDQQLDIPVEYNKNDNRNDYLVWSYGFGETPKDRNEFSDEIYRKSYKHICNKITGKLQNGQIPKDEKSSLIININDIETTYNLSRLSDHLEDLSQFMCSINRFLSNHNLLELILFYETAEGPIFFHWGCSFLIDYLKETGQVYKFDYLS